MKITLDDLNKTATAITYTDNEGVIPNSIVQRNKTNYLIPCMT